MQGGCQRCSIPHISNEDAEEHTVPGREDNRQDDRKTEGGKEQVERKRPQEKDYLDMVIQRDHHYHLLGKDFSGCFIDVDKAPHVTQIAVAAIFVRVL